MTNPVTLLPCPFCGRSAHIERVGDRGQSTIYQCDNCSCSLETGEEWGHGRTWNERADIPPPASTPPPVSPALDEVRRADLSEWAGWDRSNYPWSATKHQDAVCAAVFGPTWAMEDAAALIDFINRTWGRALAGGAE